MSIQLYYKVPFIWLNPYGIRLLRTSKLLTLDTLFYNISEIYSQSYYMYYHAIIETALAEGRGRADTITTDAFHILYSGFAHGKSLRGNIVYGII